MSQHLPRRLLERYSIDDLSPEDRASAMQHVERCEVCQVELARFGEAQRALATELPAPWFLAQIKRRASARRRSLIAVGGGILAVAAALLLWIRPPDLRMKGAGLNVYLRKDGRTQLLGAEDRIAAGDALQATLLCPTELSVRAWFVDADDRIDALTPDGPARLSAGEQPLPVSARVEAPCRDLALIVMKDARAPTETDLRTIAHAIRAGHAPKDVWARALRCR